MTTHILILCTHNSARSMRIGWASTCSAGLDTGAFRSKKRRAFELTRQAIGYRMLQLLALPLADMDRRRCLMLWILLCIVAGIGLGQLLPGPVMAIGRMEFAQTGPSSPCRWRCWAGSSSATFSRPGCQPRRSTVMSPD